MISLQVSPKGRYDLETRCKIPGIGIKTITLDKGHYTVKAWRGVRGRTNYESIEVRGMSFPPSIVKLVDYVPLEDGHKHLASRVVLEYKVEVERNFQTIVPQSAKASFLD